MHQRLTASVSKLIYPRNALQHWIVPWSLSCLCSEVRQMVTALDATADCSKVTSCLKQAGYTSVLRYYSMSAWKRMGPQEAAALSKAGFSIGVVYQDRQNQPA